MIRLRKSYVTQFPVVLIYDLLVAICISALFLVYSAAFKLFFGNRYAISYYTVIPDLAGISLLVRVIESPFT